MTTAETLHEALVAIIGANEVTCPPAKKVLTHRAALMLRRAATDYHYQIEEPT
jgi:hypothetical protein